MRVLITGGAGFIGSHLAEKLLERGDSVVVIDDLSTGSVKNIDHMIRLPRFEFVRGSVRDQMVMTPLVDRCDAIYHLAAAVGVQLIVDRPVHTIETNIHGSEVVLNLASTFRRRILLASTSEVYGKSANIPFNEDDDSVFGSTRFTRWSYACSKMIDEFLGLAYHDQYGLETVICRFFNTVGPRQTGQYGMVVPRFVRHALRDEPIEIYGNGQQSRCFCNVVDVVNALLKLIDCEDATGEVINVGANEPVTIEELADKVISLVGSVSEKRFLSYEEAYGRPFDDMQTRVPDLSKIKRLIGWNPKHSLDETLKQVIEFEQSNI